MKIQSLLKNLVAIVRKNSITKDIKNIIFRQF